MEQMVKLMTTQEIVDLTVSLASIPSDRHNEAARHEVIRTIIAYLKKHTDNDILIEIVREMSPVSKSIIESLYVRPREEKGPSTLLVGHVDVIPASDAQFAIRREGNILYGRGTGDMKSGVAIAIQLFLKRYKENNVQLLITNDEEIGGEAGAKLLASRIKPDFVIALEPTDLVIKTKEKGGMWVEVEAHGPGGHASRTWEATSAIALLLRFFNRIQERFPQLDSEAWADTVNIGGICGGTAQAGSPCVRLGSANVIAQHAAAKLDIRLTDRTTHTEALTFLRRVAREETENVKRWARTHGWDSEDYHIEVKAPETQMVHLITDEKNTYVQNLIQSYSEATGDSAEIVHGPSASDARHFSEQGIPAVVFGPTAVNMHADDEQVLVDSIERTYAVVDNFLTRTVINENVDQ